MADAGANGLHKSDRDWETTTQASIESPSQPTCPECKKTFKNELGLNGHMKTHAK